LYIRFPPLYNVLRVEECLRLATKETTVEKLRNEAELPEVVIALNELIDLVQGIKSRDRGPRSQRSMTRIDAWRVIHGDLKSSGHKEAAEALGLSYGQIYSARGTYTFKDVKRDEFRAADVTALRVVEEPSEAASD